MARTPPAAATIVPGNFLTAALWASQVTALLQWMVGTGTNGVPRFKGYATTAQSIATGTGDIPINLDSEVYDTDGGHSTTVNTSRYTNQVAGLYRITALGGFPTDSTGDRKIGINVNGANVRGSVLQGPACTNHSWCACITTDAFLNVGDYVEMVMWHTSTAATLSTATSLGFGPTLTVSWLAAS